MTRIQHRESPEIIEHESLLPSQRALLEIKPPEANWATLHKLSVAGKNQLGELLKTEINPIAIEAIENQQSYESQRLIRTMASLADRLIESDNPSAFTELVTVMVKDGYDGIDEYNGIYPAYPNRGSARGVYFTPQGFVRHPKTNFRQKVIALEMNAPGLPELENELSLHVYTDNSNVITPSWELTNERDLSDVFPSPGRYTYELHKAPEHFPDEALALSVVSSLARIIKLSDETKEA